MRHLSNSLDLSETNCTISNMAEKSRLSQEGVPVTEAILVLNNIRSVFNVGSLFRTADAVGITKIIISGFTPSPIDRFGRTRSDLAKSALGAEQVVLWEQVPDIFDCLNAYKQAGYQVIGLEQVPHSVDYKQVTPAEKIVFILGTETLGMSTELIDQCDIIAEIPMRGMKESLNVSVAAGVLLYRVLDQN